MARLRALVEKELRQHLGVAVGLLFFLPFAWLMVALGTAFAPVSITFLQTHAAFLWVFLPLTAMVLGNRLVVAEYHGRTQLFVEALPVRRSEMVAVKYGLGLAALLAIAGGSLLLASLFAARTEPLAGRFLLLMTVRTVAYVFWLWSMLFTMGFLGRFRVPLYLAMGLGLFVLQSFTALEISRFGPFAMVNGQLVLERVNLPGTELAVTLAVGAAWVVLAAVLALVNEGSMAESLARRMTLKEKSVVGALLIAAMIGSTALGERPSQAPFVFQNPARLSSDTEALEILYLHAEARPDAEALREHLEADLGELRRLLGRSEKLPMLRVALRESLDATTFEPVGLGKNDGVLVRANFRHVARGADGHLAGTERRDRAYRPLRAFLTRELLSELTADRAAFEPKAWVTDGFSRWWAERDRSSACMAEPVAAGAPPCLPLLRALWATRAGHELRADELARWFRYRERQGESVAQGVAFSGMAVLEKRRGRAAVAALARQLYGRSPALDIRELVYEWRHPLPAVFQSATQLAWPEFVAAWNAELQQLRARPAAAALLGEIPEARGAVSIEEGRGAIRNVVSTVTFPRRPPPGTAVTLLHRDLSPFEEPLARHELRREEQVAGGGNDPSTAQELQHRLTGRYGPGTRVFVALELESPQLDCPLRLLAERRDVR